MHQVMLLIFAHICMQVQLTMTEAKLGWLLNTGGLVQAKGYFTVCPSHVHDISLYHHLLIWDKNRTSGFTGF